jgi:hypothetical protein
LLVTNHSILKLAGAGLLAGLSFHLASGCGRQEAGQVTPIYNKTTGRLEQLVGSRNGDGRVDTRAQMDGARLRSVEIDRNRDGRPDRWEYYEPDQTTRRSMLVRAEEANGPDGRVTRHEYYDKGAIQRVEEDTDGDGRIDKWEAYEEGSLARMDLDLSGRGFPDRRLIYRRDGTLERTESDPTGDGRFKPPSTGHEAATGAR